jgi:hypothetical protein
MLGVRMGVVREFIVKAMARHDMNVLRNIRSLEQEIGILEWSDKNKGKRVVTLNSKAEITNSKHVFT